MDDINKVTIHITTLDDIISRKKTISSWKIERKADIYFKKKSISERNQFLYRNKKQPKIFLKIKYSFHFGINF